MNLLPETQIKFNKFRPRQYQKNFCRAFEEGKLKRFLVIWPRRAGKDICALALLVRAALRRVGTYMYIFPEFSSARRILWDAIDIDGNRIMHTYIPEEIVESRNEQQMRIRLINGSQILVIGSDNYDSTLVGTNAHGMIFSEYALQDPRAWQFAIPILNASNGWAAFISTPRSKNHLWELYQVASNTPGWFCEKLTIDDTNHIPIEEIKREIKEGQISEAMAQQEYWTSFELGASGAFYSNDIDNLRRKGQISLVPWEPYHPVYTAWDLGFNDPTTIIFFQIIGQVIRIIDCYENTKKGLDHYAKIVKEKPYTYGKHIAPHDIAVHDLGTGISRWKTMHDLGITFIRYDTKQPSIEDGIEAVRRNLPKMWFDEKSCESLLKALQNYQQEYDHKRKVYKANPLHDWSSHFCFTGDTKVLTRSGMRQIMDITENDEVMTLEGWKPCTKAMITQRSAELVEVTFRDGTKVRCTPDHLFLTEIGWKSAESLEKDTKIQSSLMRSHNISTDTFISYGPVIDTSQRVVADCIKMFGVMLLEKYQRIATFITETTMSRIMPYGISNAYQQQNICDYQDRIIKGSAVKPEMLPQNGIDLSKVDFGINDMQKEVFHGLNGLEKKERVFIALKNSKRSSEQMHIHKSSAIPIAKHLIIESVKLLRDREDVWDIGVPSVGHFSLSNGAIVHNCDAMRYLCVALPRLTNTNDPVALEKRYNDAMGYQGGNLPAVFRDDLPESGSGGFGF